MLLHMPYTSSTKVRPWPVLMGMCSYEKSHGGQAMWQDGVTLLPERHPGETGTSTKGDMFKNAQSRAIHKNLKLTGYGG